MVNQNYGTASPPASSSSTLPPTPSRPRRAIDEAQASIPSSVTNLANTVIGAGALAFPSAFAAMGLLPGMFTCVMSGCFAAFGLYLLSRCATLVGKRPGHEGRKSSFNEVARLTFGKGWATKLFDVSWPTGTEHVLRVLSRQPAHIAVARHRNQMLRCFCVIPYHLQSAFFQLQLPLSLKTVIRPSCRKSVEHSQ